MDASAGEQRKELGQQLTDQCERAGVGRLQCHGLARDAVGVHEPVGRDRQWPVGLVGQPSVHVTEAVLVRHELDVAFAAEGVERPDVVRVERARASVDVAVVPVCEGVLRVELHLVDLERRQPVHQRAQRLHGRDLVPGDVEHDTTHRKIGMIDNGSDRQVPAVEPRQLRQGHLSVEEPGVVGAGQVDAVMVDAQGVSLRGQRPIDPPRRRAGGTSSSVSATERGTGIKFTRVTRSPCGRRSTRR